ncbi:MAG: ABC transporter permease subunit [Oscillospiraceae bacterium]|jgi:polar amino acid transport system substrate-binding protein|nr:ABC transporter permease subunit [Oscillospiraceae bacterium]
MGENGGAPEFGVEDLVMKFRKVLAMCFLMVFGTFMFSFKTAALKSEIIVGLDINVPPMGFLSESNEIVGFDIDLAKEVFSDKKVTFQPIDWDAKELELNSCKIDVIWNGMSKTPEREQNMLLTRPYMKNRQIVIVNKNSAINKLEDLQNKTVCVQKGSTGSDAFKNHEISNQTKNIIELENMLNCLNEVETLKSDATVVDEIVAKYYLNGKGLSGSFKILNQEISTEDYVIAVKKGNTELKDKIERGLLTLKESGKAEEISQKWFGTNLFFWEDLELTSTEASNTSKDLSLKPIIQGLWVTFKIFLFTIIFSIPLGLILCVLQNSRRKILKLLLKIYINIVRGTPLLLQLFFVFYGLPYVPVIGGYLTIKDRFLAGILTFVFNYAAYFIEIFRSGFLAVDKGQNEAAQVLGFSKTQALFKILLPQVLRITLPTICNECVTLVKDTALIFAIGVPELLSNTKNLVNSTANISSYIITGAIYLVICMIIVQIFRKLEIKFSCGGKV